MIDFKSKLVELDKLPRKEFINKIAKIGIGVFIFSLVNPSVFAKVFELRNDDAVAININEIRGINSGTINRTGDLITSVVQGDRTITVNRDINDVVTGWEDSSYEWTLTRDVDNNITNWSVVAK